MKPIKFLNRIKKLVPYSAQIKLQHIHTALVSQWIINKGSQPLNWQKKSAMVFAPHQDDETFGCGAMIALKRQQGIPVTVVFLTDGGQGVDKQAPQVNEIVYTRKQEAIEALRILGVGESAIYFLDKKDGALHKLTQEEQRQTIAQIVELVNFHQPEEIYVPHSKDCHNDHEVTFTLVKSALKQVGKKIDLLQYPVWAFWKSRLFLRLKLQDIAVAYRVPLAPVKAQKTQAIACYDSQLISLSNAFVKHFSETDEIFFKTDY
ncbi:LmbE family protein [Calothrix sp. NIES-4071]|nr:LmbE family protein [Calothrix sp. NIES-4071]BAZ63321.1 LmbE family protein [Calothrix sp. NIES-4105]